jgi:hypothetical protein
MVAYVGKEFIASVAGRQLEPVTCERCQTQYYYELTRIGTGRGSAPYLLGQTSAANRAANAAQRELTKRLAREAEMVPCPKCHWVNQDLINRYRKRQYRRVRIPIFAVLIAGFFGNALLHAALTESYGYQSRVPAAGSAAFLGACVLAVGGILLIRYRLRQRINPNETYPRWPELPPGTPPALIQHTDPLTGQPGLKAVANRTTELPERGGTAWATFRPGQVALPRVCCVCLSAASTLYRSPFKVRDDSDVAVPLCGACRSRLRRRWWLTALWVAPAAAALGLAVLLIPGGDATGKWILGAIAGFFAMLFGVAIVPSRFCRPYRLGVVDADRGILKFAARNPRYTEMLVEQVRRSDGIAAR